MKKSEAIRSLEGFLSMLDTTIEPVPYKEKAEGIIKFVTEALEMLPPKSKDYLPPDTEDFMSETMGHKWESECDCGSTSLPIQKLGGLICADCRKVI